MSTQGKAHELANEFLKEPVPAGQAQQSPQRFSFNVVDAQGKGTGESVEISVFIKASGLRKSAAMSRSASLNEVSQFSAGSPCPTCRGTGSI